MAKKAKTKMIGNDWLRFLAPLFPLSHLYLIASLLLFIRRKSAPSA